MATRVFIVDDSAVVRKVLTDMLQGIAGIKVIGSAQDPIYAQRHMEKDWPDVIILDVEMPRMDGLTFLKKIMKEHPTPVVMCSTLTLDGSKTTLEALRLGAIEVVAKPLANLKTSLPEASRELIGAIRTAAKANLSGIKPKSIPRICDTRTKLSADAMLQPTKTQSRRTSDPAIVIGASTGGTQALEVVLAALPANTLPILVVQHMPAFITATFAKRLNELCTVEVKEAEDNDALIPGRVLIAPGGKHMMMQVTQFGTSVQVKDGPLVRRHKPSVDVLFRSVSKYADENTLGIIMTGMGDDGARGIAEMHEHGVKTIAQDEASCVVYGMPREAMKLGAIDHQLPLDKIAKRIAEHGYRRRFGAVG